MGIKQNCDVRKELRKFENLILLSQLLSDETRGFEKNISGSLTDGSLGAEEDLVTWLLWPPLTNQRAAFSLLTNHKRLRLEAPEPGSCDEVGGSQ